MNTDQERLDRLHEQVADAIRQVRARIRWKPGKGVEHLHTRIRYGHLPATAKVADYEAIIYSILHDPTLEVYAYI